jgi:hypothetical protein
MSNKSKLFIASVLALGGALMAGTAQARDDVQWSVTIGAPIGVPVYTQPVPVYQPQYYYYQHYQRGHYQRPTQWDRDGDGIPNRYDRRYNPRWDRDGDGIPNRYDSHYDRRHWDRDRDGVPNWRDRSPYGR